MERLAETKETIISCSCRSVETLNAYQSPQNAGQASHGILTGAGGRCIAEGKMAYVTEKHGMFGLVSAVSDARAHKGFQRAQATADLLQAGYRAVSQAMGPAIDWLEQSHRARRTAYLLRSLSCRDLAGVGGNGFDSVSRGYALDRTDRSAS